MANRCGNRSASSVLARSRSRVEDCLLRLAADQSGQISIIFALCSVLIFGAIGAGIDLSRAYLARQELSEVAALACQYASRPAIIQTAMPSYTGSNGRTQYLTAVDSFITTTLQGQHFNFTQTNGSPFTYATDGPASVNLTSTVPTSFMKVLHVSTMPLSVTTNCFAAPADVVQRVANGNLPYIAQEGFETSPCSGSCGGMWLPSGAAWNGSSTIAPSSSFPATVGYTGQTGSKWYIMGYCLEIDTVGLIKSTTPQGTHSAELDCDNGSGSAGNSSISTEAYLAAGNYQIQWSYASRVSYPDYDPAYICGSAAADVSWANDSKSSGGVVTSAVRTNQVNVYLDLNTTGAPPTHATIDGTEALAGSNLIDVCIESTNWIQRTINVTVTTPGYYWLSFAADGQNDSEGGQIDNINVCIETCPGTVEDDWTAVWANNTLLFEDNFESPTYSGSPESTSGNINNSYGSSSFTNESNIGWANAPTNQIPYWRSGCPQATQCVQLGWSGNSLISKPFLLVPGYYQISYNYVSEVTFSALSSVYCGATPIGANISTLTASSSAAKSRVQGTSLGSVNNDTNTVGVFMSHAQLASTPNTGNALGSTTSYTNPSGTVTTTPTTPPNAISLTSYNSSQSNPLVDICGYAASAQTRTAVVLIQKPAFYWLTFAALGTSDAYGGQIDDVKITALTSPYYSTYAAGAVTIPVPAPQPGSTIAFTGFSINGDVLTQ